VGAKTVLLFFIKIMYEYDYKPVRFLAVYPSLSYLVVQVDWLCVVCNGAWSTGPSGPVTISFANNHRICAKNTT
jgi:hypothetical protein